MLDHKLYTFLKVIELGSFSKAAAELNLTQPAVSQQISQLEEELGVPLLIRKRGSLTLTPQGEIACRYARNLLKTYSGIWSELDDLNKEYRHIMVGITPIAQSSPLVDVLVRYSARKRDLKFSMYEQNPERICNLIQTGVVSWGILDSVPMDRLSDSDLQVLTLETEQLECVLCPGHPLAAGESVSIADLRKEAMLLPQPKYTSTALFSEALQQAGSSLDDLRIILETDDVAALKRYAAEGIGITVLPRSCCEREVRSGELVLRPIREIHVSSRVCMVYAEGNRDLDILHEIAAQFRIARGAGAVPDPEASLKK